MATQALRGTPSELSGRLIVNGRRLNQPEISMLSRLLDGNGIEKVGTAKRSGARGGKPATILEINPDAMKFEVKMGRKTRSKGHPDDEGDNDNGNDNGSEQSNAGGSQSQQAKTQDQPVVDQAMVNAIAQGVALALSQQNKASADKSNSNETETASTGGEQSNAGDSQSNNSEATGKQDENKKSSPAKKSAPSKSSKK